MTLAVLLLIFYSCERRWRYVMISGVLAGLAFLTKIQALVILPSVCLIGLLINCPLGISRVTYHSLRYCLTRTAGLMAVWLLVAGLTWVVVWPAMWVAPVRVLAEAYDYATHMSGLEGAQVFFLGQNYENVDPGPLFYPVVFLMRITPLALLGLVGFVSCATCHVARGRYQVFGTQQDKRFSARKSVLLITYVLVYVALMTWGSHKQDRYLMPIF